MDEYEYISYRLGLMESNSIRHKRNEKNDLLLKVLTSHNLGGVNSGFPAGMYSKSAYRDVLSNVLYIIEKKSDIELHKVIFFEHVIVFGYHNISKNDLMWSNLVDNFRLVLSDEFYCIGVETESNPDIKNLCYPLNGMSDPDFDMHFFYFFERVVTSHFKIKGFRFQNTDKFLITLFKGKIVSIFPIHPSAFSVYNSIRVIVNFVQKMGKTTDSKILFDTITFG